MERNANGFFWYELMTADVAAAKAFYGKVVGWETQDLGGPHAGYTLLQADGIGVAGAMQLSDADCGAGSKAGWVGYVQVEDADAAAARIEAGGGRVLRPPSDIPEVGRFAAVADPQGAVFMSLAPLPRDDAPPPAPRMRPGRAGWHELYAEDGDAVFPFYAEQFGWTEDSVMNMGPMGNYRLFRAGGDEAVGGIMTRQPHVPKPVWNFYFVVDGIDAAAARITESGGTVTMGPMQVPDGSFIVMAADPEGVSFALVSTTR
ncbi:VOC family protein [Sphingosinicella sp. BN140058]|uniref:VOC family protein n=1 Tax=Sphingosinicella sp. BN140058 TaxID=1892855 RepID=UPI0010103834|nr:VOC family protein [Sphingosinicella sp. BN140058]QAY78484.1 VOC family protein [Sphingosinicella sp. BN140058]